MLPRKSYSKYDLNELLDDVNKVLCIFKQTQNKETESRPLFKGVFTFFNKKRRKNWIEKLSPKNRRVVAETFNKLEISIPHNSEIAITILKKYQTIIEAAALQQKLTQKLSESSPSAAYGFLLTQVIGNEVRPRSS